MRCVIHLPTELFVKYSKASRIFEKRDSYI